MRAVGSLVGVVGAGDRRAPGGHDLAQRRHELISLKRLGHEGPALRQHRLPRLPSASGSTSTRIAVPGTRVPSWPINALGAVPSNASSTRMMCGSGSAARPPPAPAATPSRAGGHPPCPSSITDCVAQRLLRADQEDADRFTSDQVCQAEPP